MSTDDLSPTKVLWAVMGVTLTIGLGIGGWLCQRSIAHDAQIQAVQYQLSAIILSQANTISPVVEASLRELRDKTNSDRDLIGKLTEIATGNAKDIGYLREQIAKKP